jgi:hypothetical protein
LRHHLSMALPFSFSFIYTEACLFFRGGKEIFLKKLQINCKDCGQCTSSI